MQLYRAHDKVNPRQYITIFNVNNSILCIPAHVGNKKQFFDCFRLKYVQIMLFSCGFITIDQLQTGEVAQSLVLSCELTLNKPATCLR